MSDTKFSKGPWRVQLMRDHILVRGADEGMTVAEVRDDPDNPLALADSALIASAPDLYAALDELVELVVYNGSKTSFTRREAAVTRAIDALRKARGES